MGSPIPPVFKYSIVYNLLNFPPILIKFESKFIVCKVLYFKAQYFLRLRYPLNCQTEFNQTHDSYASCLIVERSITKTRLYNFEPLKPFFYIVKQGFTGVYIIFLIFAQKHRLWVLVRTALP